MRQFAMRCVSTLHSSRFLTKGGGRGEGEAEEGGFIKPFNPIPPCLAFSKLGLTNQLSWAVENETGDLE